ncbi:hypothetical protein COO60DRAFT_1641403 [Scenedesmus sp. NREL 46B-D3]|nr:hypothetical protein COO60DRAFT_1641403 [Scenedesmus sp. NREL 46B-D3]
MKGLIPRMDPGTALVQEYRERKAAGDFEVRRPKTTKEIAERPTAPRPTADEQEEQAEEQRQQLLRRVQELQEGGAVPGDDIHVFADPKSTTAGAGMLTPPRQARQTYGLPAGVMYSMYGSLSSGRQWRQQQEHSDEDSDEELQQQRHVQPGRRPRQRQKQWQQQQDSGEDSEDQLQQQQQQQQRQRQQQQQQRQRQQQQQQRQQQQQQQQQKKLQQLHSDEDDDEDEDLEYAGEDEGVDEDEEGAQQQWQRQQQQQQRQRQRQQHDMFPNLQDSTAGYTGRPSKFGGVLSGASRQVPNPADWVAADHSGWAAAREQQQLQQQFSYFRQGAVNESSRKAAMASGISGAAAGSGAVPAGQGADESAQAKHQQLRKPKQGKPVPLKTTAAGAAAAAAAAAGAVQSSEAAAAAAAGAKRVGKALPAFSALSTVPTLWSCYSKGYNGGQAWQVQEQQGTSWRRGERKRWCELKKVIDEVKYVAVQNQNSYEWAAQQLDDEMKQGKHSIAHFIKKVVGPRVTQRENAAAAAKAAAAAAAAWWTCSMIS